MKLSKNKKPKQTKTVQTWRQTLMQTQSSNSSSQITVIPTTFQSQSATWESIEVYGSTPRKCTPIYLSGQSKRSYLCDHSAAVWVSPCCTGSNHTAVTLWLKGSRACRATSLNESVSVSTCTVRKTCSCLMPWDETLMRRREAWLNIRSSVFIPPQMFDLNCTPDSQPVSTSMPACRGYKSKSPKVMYNPGLYSACYNVHVSIKGK